MQKNVSSKQENSRQRADQAPGRDHEDRLGFLDGIRGGAALWVVAFHCRVLSGWAFPAFTPGAAAVDIFMLISGFLMTFHYYRREDVEPWNQPSTWYAFYTRRFFRIAPLYYLLLVPTFWFDNNFQNFRAAMLSVFRLALLEHPKFDPTVLGTSLESVLLHITFLFGLFPQYASSNALPDWSIGLEMQFYLCFPFLMLFLARFGGLWFIAFTCVIAAIANYCYGVYTFDQPGLLGLFPQPSFLPLKLPLFAIGILLASAHHSGRERKDNEILILLAATTAIILTSFPVQVMVFLLIALLFYDREANQFKIKWPIELLNKFLSNRVSTFLADTSYSVYLLHMLFLWPVGYVLSQWQFYVGLPGSLRFAILFAIVSLSSYSVGWLLFQTVEKPGIAFGKSLLRKRLSLSRDQTSG